MIDSPSIAVHAVARCKLASLSVYIYIYIYTHESEPKSSYDEVISAVDNFLTKGIQELQHWLKYYVDQNRDYFEK